VTDAPTDQGSQTAIELAAPSGAPVSSTKILHGRLIPPQQQILLYSAEEWEEFILEWVHYQKTQYQKVVRLSGATDMGIDVAGFMMLLDFEVSGITINVSTTTTHSRLAPRFSKSEKCCFIRSRIASSHRDDIISWPQRTAE
jgi:hypothetical protein